MTEELIKALDEEIATELVKRSSEFVKTDNFSGEEVDESQPLLSNYILGNRYSRWHSCIVDNRKYYKVKTEILSNIVNRLIFDDPAPLSFVALKHLCKEKHKITSALDEPNRDAACIEYDSLEDAGFAQAEIQALDRSLPPGSKNPVREILSELQGLQKKLDKLDSKPLEDKIIRLDTSDD